MIEFKAITKDYADSAALQAIDLCVASGELFVLVGPSGSGKTTLLKTVNRLVVPTSGQVLIDGVDVATGDLQTLRRHIGYVLQSSALFPNMTVMQNASVQLEALGWPKARIRPRIEALLRLVDLEPTLYAERRPAELSGGEAQRVGIVRALAADPKLMLMDEPFSALDPVSRRQLQALILKLHRELDTTILFVTHDMQEALHLADRMAVLHDGVLQQVGQPQAVIAEPANAFVADFFKDVIAGQRTLAQVLAAGFGRPTTAAGKPLPATTSIYAWANALAAEPRLAVQVGQTQLDATDLIGYLASLDQKEVPHA
ncbi:ABC transporter ATP-binding protein [Lacticaseibacillus kribbianus]|uniref:ABC transporter ATP-binding protein n=1 Tax=Lacticaseibacillus kribbianus TaxID=2926292 RepID=UPI001CD57677